MKEKDVIIIGAGAAGLSAGIYLKRSSVSSLLLEKNAPGGKLLNIHEIDNYPSIEHISGPDLAMKLYEHAANLGVEYEYGNVLNVFKEGDDFKVITDVEQYNCKAIIVATGMENKVSGIPGEKELLGKGISYCATCDGNFFKGKDVAVIGYKDQAVEEAIYLAGLVNKLYFIMPDELESTEAHVNTLKGFSNVIWQKGKLKSINGEDKVSSITIEKDDGEESINLSGVFPLFGERSSAQFLSSLGIDNNRGFIKVDANCRSNIEGIFAAGDIIDKRLRQVVTANSDGAIAATSAIAYINSKRKKA